MKQNNYLYTINVIGKVILCAGCKMEEYESVMFNITSAEKNVNYNNSTTNTGINASMQELDSIANCSDCLNEFCFSEQDYKIYLEWISVSPFETVLVLLNIIQFLAGVLGNLLVSSTYDSNEIIKRKMPGMCQ